MWFIPVMVKLHFQQPFGAQEDFLINFFVNRNFTIMAFEVSFLYIWNTVPSTNIGTLDKYEQRRLWK